MGTHDFRVKEDPVVVSEACSGITHVLAATRFEVFLRSSPGGENQPFPECSWNEYENRWEWSCALILTLLGLAKGLGCPLLIHPLATTEGDLDVLEICDVEVETVADWTGP